MSIWKQAAVAGTLRYKYKAEDEKFVVIAIRPTYVLP